jgi:hypothetical protein
VVLAPLLKLREAGDRMNRDGNTSPRAVERLTASVSTSGLSPGTSGVYWSLITIPRFIRDVLPEALYYSCGVPLPTDHKTGDQHESC